MPHPIETAKHATDVASVGVLLGTISQALPAVAALLTIIWTGLRIYEWFEVRRGKANERP